MMTATRATLVTLAFAIMLALASSIAPDRVLAHAGLESSVPAASTVLEQSPPMITLDFDEDIDLPLTSIQLFGAGSTSVELGPVTQGGDASVVEAGVPALADGTYAVIWRISSADGHVVTGAFSFQVGTRSTADGDALIDDVVGGVRADASVGRALGIARFAAFVGVTLLLGGLMMLMLTDVAVIGWPARRLLWIGWLSLLAGSLANFGLLGANAAAGGVNDALDSSLWSDIADTRTGQLLLIRLALLVVLLGAVLALVRGRERLWWRTLVPMLGVLTVFTFSGGGHPSVQDKPLLWIGVDALHLTLVALWLGGLAMMTFGGRNWLRDDDHSGAVRSFSKMATIGVPLIVATGVLQAWRLSGGLDELTETTWGRVLLAKGTLVVLVVTIGAASRWLLANDGPRGLRRTVLTESLMGVAVLGLAAGLLAVPPDVGEPSRVFTASLAEAGVIAEVSLTPGRVGSNQVHVVVTPPGGSLVPVAGLVARVSLPSQAVPAGPVTLVAESANHYSGNVTLAFAGEWTLELVVSPEPTQSILLSTTVPIP